MTEQPLDDTWLQKLDNTTSTGYLHLGGFRDVLTDTYYSGRTDLRPPKNDVKADAPPAPPAPPPFAPDGPAPINTPNFIPPDNGGGPSFAP
jgi:hypothetical protein